MGKEAPEQTTTQTQTQPALPGALWAYQGALDYWNALMRGEGPTWGGGALSPWEQQTIGAYGQSVLPMLGEGGMFQQAQEAISPYLQPEYLDVASDPNWQAAMEQAYRRVAQQFAGAGMGYSSPSAEAQQRTAADLLFQEQARRESLQTGLSEWASGFPLEAATSFMPMAGLDWSRNYAEWLRQFGATEQGAQMLGQLGLGGAPRQTSSTGVTSGGPKDYPLLDVLGYYTMANPGWLPWVV